MFTPSYIFLLLDSIWVAFHKPHVKIIFILCWALCNLLVYALKWAVSFPSFKPSLGFFVIGIRFKQRD